MLCLGRRDEPSFRLCGAPLAQVDRFGPSSGWTQRRPGSAGRGDGLGTA